ncbi:MAG: hypothetical protein EOM48_03600 [Bacilli bacterium]|nr:hypothetical protein [Bacilli bacterium]
MKNYKAIRRLKDFSSNELNSFASLFSSKQSLINNDQTAFMCAAFNPDHYLQNEDKISEFFANGYFQPLIVTNYKLLALLLVVSKKTEYSFTDFSFKEDGEDAELEKEAVEEMLTRSEDVVNISNFLKINSQKIQYIELQLHSHQNRIRVYSSGTISLTNSFDKKLYPYILSIVQFLFTGSMTEL